MQHIKKLGRVKMVRTCSPTDKETSRIAREYGFSDQRNCFVPSLRCGHEQVLGWPAVQWDADMPETARILCSGCGSFWSENDRKAAIRALETAPAHGFGARPSPSRAVGPRRLRKCGLPRVDRFAFTADIHRLMPATPVFTFRSSTRCAIGWPTSSPSFWNPRMISSFAGKWKNTALAETWERPIGEGLDGSTLMARRELYGPLDLPMPIKVIAAFCDTQDDRLEVYAPWEARPEPLPLPLIRHFYRELTPFPEGNGEACLS